MRAMGNKKPARGGPVMEATRLRHWLEDTLGGT